LHASNAASENERKKLNALKGGVLERKKFKEDTNRTVVSDKMDKTVVVAVVDSVRHPLYKRLSSAP
jgi:hypothetical protein